MKQARNQWAEALMVKHDAIEDNLFTQIAEAYEQASKDAIALCDELWDTLPRSIEKEYEIDRDFQDPLWNDRQFELGPVFCTPGIYNFISKDRDLIKEGHWAISEDAGMCDTDTV